MAVTTYTSNGTPLDSIGVQGDMNIDYVGKFLWGPKGATSWAGTANSIVGPTGPLGPSPVLPAMVNTSSAWAPAAQYAAVNVPTSSAPPGTPANMIGTTQPYIFTPQVNSALTGLTVSNYSASGATVYFFLYDLTTSTLIYNFNSGNGIANNTSTSVSLGNTAYPLTAGHRYQWQALRASGGATTVNIYPQYLVPSGAPSSLSYYTNGVINTSTAVASTGSVALSPPGLPGQGIIYKNALGSYLYFLEAYLAGSGVADIYLYNQSASANQFTQDAYGYTTLTATPTRYTFGPFSPTTWPFVANNQYSLNIYAPSGALTIASANVTLTVGQ